MTLLLTSDEEHHKQIFHTCYCYERGVRNSGPFFRTSSIPVETELRLKFSLICVTIVFQFEKHWRYCTFVPSLSLELGFRLVLSRVLSWWIINKRRVRKYNNAKTLLSPCYMDTLPSLVLQYNHIPPIYLQGRHPY